MPTTPKFTPASQRNKVTSTTTFRGRIPPRSELLSLVPYPDHQVIGRHSEIAQLRLILAKKRMNSAILIGPAGVGKTEIVRQCAKLMPKHRFLALNIMDLTADTMYRGDFELKIKPALAELTQGDILFVDEIHTLLNAGAVHENPQGNLGNYLKPLLTDGLVIWGATTNEEFFKTFAHDHAFVRRFSPVFVTDLSTDDTILAVKAFIGDSELPAGITIEDITYAAASIPLAHLPEAAIELADRAIASVKIDLPFDLMEHADSLAQLYQGLETNRHF